MEVVGGGEMKLTVKHIPEATLRRVCINTHTYLSLSWKLFIISASCSLALAYDVIEGGIMAYKLL